MSGFKTAVLGAIGSRIMTEARVDAVEIITPQFRLITLSAQKFTGATLQPAAKIRLNAGNWEMRAYTPLAIDPKAGRIQILAYLHGAGPGSLWAGSARPGDVTHILGPQPSLELTGLAQPAVFFGDETSFAAAKTLHSHLAPGHAARFIFELSSAAEAQAVAERLDLPNTQFHLRQPGDTHLPLVTTAIQQALAGLATSQLVLTGNGRAIQSIRATLRAGAAAGIGYHVKAYWTPGKTGLE